MLKFPSLNTVFCFVFLILIMGVACTPQKNTRYFQTIPYNSEIQTLISKDFEHKIKVGDILTIAIISPSEEARNYNTSPEGYLVDKNGNIQIYKIGDVRVLDLTLTQVKEKIIRQLVPDIFVQASVSARFKNHKIVVLGEVGSPGVIPMETEHLSVLEAVALRGDLAANARRDNLLVIRNTPKGKMFYRINLLDGSVFNSPFYYLQPDDIIYVEAEPQKKDGTVQQVISYAISGISVLLLIFDRINR